MDINGKTIMITGAGQGLGRSMALALAGKGARLALADIDDERLKDTERGCREIGAEAGAYAADIAEEAAVERLFNQVARDFSRIDGLINNAGTNADALLVKQKDGGIRKMSLQDFHKVVAVDLLGVFLCGREAAVHMIEERHGGVIVNISSISRAGNVGQTNYAAAKAGVAAMTVTWAQELARYGIRVAGVAPGFSETRMVARMKPELQEQFKRRIPLNRFGKPDEIADAVLFIFENDYYNGRILEVDGGLRL